MNAIRATLIALLVVGLTLFSVANSQTTWVNFGFTELGLPLYLVVLASFLLGLLPVWLWLSADRMLLGRKLKKAESALAKVETDLAQARVELLRPPWAAAAPAGTPAAQPQTIPQPAPPPGT